MQLSVLRCASIFIDWDALRCCEVKACQPIVNGLERSFCMDLLLRHLWTERIAAIIRSEILIPYLSSLAVESGSD